MRRRDFIKVVAGSAVTWPLAARAQAKRTYRLASLTAGSPVPSNSPSGKTLFSALAQRGYTIGGNLEYQPYGAALQIALLPQLAQDIAANRLSWLVI
jgi:hypothetical protein